MKHLTLLAALAACTHDRHVASPTELVGEQLVVETVATGELEAVLVPDGTGALVARTPRGDIPFAAVKRVTETSYMWGALEGGGIGLAIGGAGGILLGLASGPDECDTSRGSDFCTGTHSAADNAFILGVVIGAVGGLVGLVVGGVKGTDFVYEF